MKKMRILVVDDTDANIEAAKIAAVNFPQHEFIFMNSGNDAFTQLNDFDAVITDLFFQEEPTGDEMMSYYKEILAMYSLENSYYLDLVEGNKNMQGTEKLNKNISVVKNGLQKKLYSNEALAAPEFPLGLSIMIKAKKANKLSFLISDIHSHGSADAEILLLPLYYHDILDKYSIAQDGVKSIYYFGSNRIIQIHGEYLGGKSNALTWEKAIYCILAQ